MNNNSTATVTIPIVEWNQLQDKIKKLEEIVSAKKTITFGTKYDGPLRICTGDSATYEIIKSLSDLFRESSDQLKTRVALEYELRELKTKLRGLEIHAPIKK